MYIYFVQGYNFNTVPIYSNDDLGHYWHIHAALYCGLLLILLKSWLMSLQYFEMKLTPKLIIRICGQWRVLMKTPHQ